MKILDAPLRLVAADLGNDRGGRRHHDVRDQEAAVPEDHREEGQQVERNQRGTTVQSSLERAGDSLLRGSS